MELLKHRARVSVAITAGMLVLAAAAVGQYVFQQHDQASAQLQDIGPRLARVLGLRDAGPELERRVKEASAALDRLGYGPDRDVAKIGSSLQQTVRRGLEAAGLTVSSSQVLPARTDGKVEWIGVSVQADGPLSRLQLALVALQAEAPVISVDFLGLQPIGGSGNDGSPMMSAKITASAMRVAP